MRRFLDGLCVVVAFVIVGASPLAADSAWAAVHKTEAAAPVAAPSVACLGGVLNDRDASDYLTAADYPAFAALTAGLRRIFICGDSIPSFLPSSQRAGFMSRRR
ncbi:MAG: hypothetical protein ABSF67_19715 [Roseiarcus sp.]|jgi:hypothetical protein